MVTSFTIHQQQGDSLTNLALQGTHGPLARYVKVRVAHVPGMPGTFPRQRGFAIPTCITTRAWRPCRVACRDRWLAVSYEVGGGENVLGILSVCATHNFTYLPRGPCGWSSNSGIYTHANIISWSLGHQESFPEIDINAGAVDWWRLFHVSFRWKWEWIIATDFGKCWQNFYQTLSCSKTFLSKGT